MNIKPGFFPKFAERGCLFVFTRIHFALRKKPRAVVLLRPEGTAEMHEQELKLAILTAVQKKPGADFGGFRHWSVRWIETQLTATRVCRRIRRKRRQVDGKLKSLMALSG